MDISRNLGILIVKSQSGERDAMEELIKIYRQLILKASNRYYLRNGEKDDLIQEASIAFLEAITNYDIDNTKITLDSFAYICMTRKLNSCIRKANSIKHKILNEALLNAPLMQGDFPETVPKELISPYGNPEELFIFEEEKTTYLDYINKKFPGSSADIVDLRIQGYSYNEISEKLGISKKHIDNALHKIRKGTTFGEDCQVLE